MDVFFCMSIPSEIRSKIDLVEQRDQRDHMCMAN